MGTVESIVFGAWVCFNGLILCAWVWLMFREMLRDIGEDRW